MWNYGTYIIYNDSLKEHIDSSKYSGNEWVGTLYDFGLRVRDKIMIINKNPLVIKSSGNKKIVKEDKRIQFQFSLVFSAHSPCTHHLQLVYIFILIYKISNADYNHNMAFSAKYFL